MIIIATVKPVTAWRAYFPMLSFKINDEVMTLPIWQSTEIISKIFRVDFDHFAENG